MDRATRASRFKRLIALSAMVLVTGLALNLGMLFPTSGIVIAATSSQTATQTRPSPASPLAITHWDPAGRVGGISVLSPGDAEPTSVAGNDGLFYGEVVWVSNGTHLLFTAGPVDGSTSLHISRADGSERVEIAPAASDGISGLALSPTGERVAFVRWESERPGRVYVIGIDGTNETELAGLEAAVTIDPDFACSPIGQPSFRPLGWTSDGSEVVLEASASCGEVEFREIVIADTQSKSPPDETAESARGLGNTRWSRGASLIAYESDSGITVEDPAGNQRRRIGPGASPSLSRNGQLSFVRATNWDDISTQSLWVAPNADADSSRQVAGPVGVAIGGAQWSPDEHEVAFIGVTETEMRLWTIPVDGSETATARTMPRLGFVLSFNYFTSGS